MYETNGDKFLWPRSDIERRVPDHLLILANFLHELKKNLTGNSIPGTPLDPQLV